MSIPTLLSCAYESLLICTFPYSEIDKSHIVGAKVLNKGIIIDVRGYGCLPDAGCDFGLTSRALRLYYLACGVPCTY